MSRIKDHLEQLIDALEDEHGPIEGFECIVDHPIEAGMRDPVGAIKQFVIYYLHKEEIKIQ
jgi:hypothetical protein